MASNHKIKIAIAEDCKIMRDLLKGNLQMIPGLSVIIEAPNGLQLLKEIGKAKPDVVILDVRMDVMDGIEAAYEIKKINPNIKIIAWSVYTNWLTIFKMLDAGASAFLDKEIDMKELKKCIFGVYKDGIYFNEYFNKAMHESMVRGDNHSSYRFGEILLSVDEIELIRKICRGMNNKEIAADSGKTVERTIQRHVKDILDKTHTGCLPLLAIFAVKNGIISLKEINNQMNVLNK